MHILAPTLFLLATASHGVNGQSGFTTKTRGSKAPLVTRVPAHHDVNEDAMLRKPRCKRLAICPTRSALHAFGAEDPDNCMDTCRLDYPKFKPTQDCCNYCDEFMGCCPVGDDHLVPFMCTSGTFRFSARTKVGPDPYTNPTKHYRNQNKTVMDWGTICAGEWWDEPDCEEPSNPDDWYLTKRADKAYYLDRWRGLFTNQYMRDLTDVWPQREAVMRKMRMMWEDDEQGAGREAPFDEGKWKDIVRTKFPKDQEIEKRWCKPSGWCAPKH